MLLQVDLRRGIFKQYCFDRDCRLGGFRGSDELPIPTSLALEFRPKMVAVSEGIGPVAIVSAPLVAAGTSGLPLVEDGDRGAGKGELDDSGASVSAEVPLAICHTSSGSLAATQPPALEHADWLSEAELAALPLDDIVASQELSSACARDLEAADIEHTAEGDVTEEALAAMPLDEIVASHRARSVSGGAGGVT